MINKFTCRLPARSMATATIALALAACGSNSTDQDGDQTGQNQQSELLTEQQPSIGAATSSDFVAIRVEAENYSALSGGWTLTDHNNIPNILPDPDPPHHGNASGFANMELLPDSRVTHADQNIGGRTFWPTSGSGPRLEYTLDIPEPGRYLVWVKSFSTGTEDNGIHVGLNGQTTPTGDRIQWCAGKHNWTWSSAQRVDENHCGIPKRIYLDIENAGSNNVIFYAREDGFEIDQFMLLKDTSNGSTDCEPQSNDQLKCKSTSNGKTTGTYDIPITATLNGNIVGPPPANLVEIDMDLDLAVNRQTALVGESIEYTVDLKNNDTTYTATSVKVQVNFDSLLAFESSADCSSTGGTSIECSSAELNAGASTSFTFRLMVNGEGSPRVDAQVSFDQSDNNPGNNAESRSITTSPAIPDYDGSISVLASPNAIGLADNLTNTLLVTNAGLQTISGATVQIEADPAIAVQSGSAACVDTIPLTCMLQDIEPGSSTYIPLTLLPQAGGRATINSQLTVPGDEDTTNNTATTTLLIRDEPVASIVNNDIAIEAERFYSQSMQASSEGGIQSGWSIDSGDITPKINPDFDQADPSTSSLGGYVEFLPDNRLSTQDPQTDGVSNFALGGESSTLEYRVFIDKVGQYYVNARIRATNSEDATIHIGMNGSWPATASSITVCNPNGDWQWTNSQKINSCDTADYATLDVTSPGVHTISVSSGTDGVEVDKLLLRLDDSSLPTGFSIDQQTYIFPDLDLAIGGTIERLQQATEDRARTYEIRVHNLDAIEAAYDITVQIDGMDVLQVAEIQGFEDCQVIEESIVCKIHSIAAAGVAVASVDIDDEDREILSKVSVAGANDTDPTNNSVVTTYGGGMLTPGFLLLLVFSSLSLIRRKART